MICTKHTARGGKLWCAIDWLIALIFSGASFYDYFAYGFSKKRYSGRDDFMTFRKHSKIQKLYNDQRKIKVMRDKELFNEIFKDYLGRESHEFKNLSKEEFVHFFESNEEIFIKDSFGLCGKNIGVYNIKETDAHQLYNQLKSDSSIKYLIESCMKQHDSIARLHPWSINTIRIVTLYDKISDKVEIVCARQRIGNFKNRVDNFHQGGLCAVIDLDTGIISSVGYDKNGKQYVRHPLTQEIIPGFQEPNWEACKRFACKMAKIVPEVGYVGWDIVVLQDGSFAVIEGNDNADHDVQQIDGNGIWPKYKRIIKQRS